MQIRILGTEYEVIDVLSNITIVDSAVGKKHKIGFGQGERKLYLRGNVEERENFFDGFATNIQGFLLKENLLNYLNMTKKEYKEPRYEYRGKEGMPREYDELKRIIEEKEDVLKFAVKKSDVTHSGIYINQASGKRTDANWNLIGDIALPKISRLSILKLEKDSEIKYYFKLSYSLVDIEEAEDDEIEKSIEKIENSKLNPTEKETLILARIGQGIYRRRLLEETSACPFTLVDDEHLLIASHIKPWKKSSNNEKKDPKNGFVFTPTYDKLFDRGYISFTDDKKLIVSPWISRYNCDRLGLEDGVVLEKLPNIDEKRKKYLEYHRTNILKKLEDL